MGAIDPPRGQSSNVAPAGTCRTEVTIPRQSPSLYPYPGSLDTAVGARVLAIRFSTVLTAPPAVMLKSSVHAPKENAESRLSCGTDSLGSAPRSGPHTEWVPASDTRSPLSEALREAIPPAWREVLRLPAYATICPTLVSEKIAPIGCYGRRTRSASTS